MYEMYYNFEPDRKWLDKALEIRKQMKECGLGMDSVVKTTVLLADIKDFGAMNEVYKEYFSLECPARSAFEVANLPKGASVEIEAIAYKED